MARFKEGMSDQGDCAHGRVQKTRDISGEGERGICLACGLYVDRFWHGPDDVDMGRREPVTDIDSGGNGMTAWRADLSQEPWGED